MIAGCLNQAKRILEKFDDILYGSSPEELVQTTHNDIKKLLLSDEGRAFFRAQEVGEESSGVDGTTLVKKLIEAVAPIVPITLRNKSLDGKYFRTALHLLAAGELLFAQYEADVRIQANPSGVVGMASAMHADLENSCFYNNDLKPLLEFTREMKSQYQTSLGLGTPFSKDTYNVTKRRRGNRGRSYYRSRFSQGLTRGQARQVPLTGGDPRIATPTPLRGQGECFAYNAGTCHRGASCRFLHVNRS